MSAKLTGPLAVTAEVTSSSAHVPLAVAPAPPSDVALGAGALAQVIPVSVQSFPTLDTLPPSGLSSVTNRRSLATSAAR